MASKAPAAVRKSTRCVRRRLRRVCDGEDVASASSGRVTLLSGFGAIFPISGVDRAPSSPQAKPAQARAKPSPPSGFGGPRAQGLRSCKPSQARKPWPEYWGKKIIVGSQFTLKILLVGPYASKYNFTAQISVVLDSCKCNYWEDFASVIWPESPNETNMVKTKSELTSTPRKSPGPSQARPSPVGGLGLGPEDFQAQARPSQAQALAFRPSQALGITNSDIFIHSMVQPLNTVFPELSQGAQAPRTFVLGLCHTVTLSTKIPWAANSPTPGR
ncbi:hypothetical protein C8R47DRAFT_1075595 [Mycena vitilis]|nr:hypothetical protein C8R47DRAFT_1075595 [Mycena vitilis]